jgi:hypothetical protein
MVLAALVVAQLALPALAERKLRGELAQSGQVESVHIRAFPAVTLLWRHANSVEVRMREYTAGRDRLADLLANTRHAGHFDGRVSILRVGPLVMRDAVLRKSGTAITGEASITEADLRAALPPGLDVRPMVAEGGGLVFLGTLGGAVSARVDAVVSEGKLLLVPAVPFGEALTVTVFSDPRVLIEGVGATQRPDGFTLTGRARLAD